MPDWHDNGDEMPEWRRHELENQLWHERLNRNIPYVSPEQREIHRQADDRRKQAEAAAAERSRIKKAEKEQAYRREVFRRHCVLIVCVLWILTSFGAFVYGFSVYDTDTAENTPLLIYAGIGGIFSIPVTVAVTTLWKSPTKPR